MATTTAPAATPAPNIARLQSLVDAATSPGLIVVRASSRTIPVQQLDKRGRNRAAAWSKCTACNGAREIQSPVDGLWDHCDACDGEGAVMGAVSLVTVPVVEIAVGRTTHSIPMLFGPDGNRPDLWTARTEADLETMVQGLVKAHK